MSYDITFEQIDELYYKVTDDENDVYFIGELDDALYVYSSWTNGGEPPFDLEYFIDYDPEGEVMIIVELEDEEEDED